MKLRIQGNSLRLRLSGQEIQQFKQSGQVSETLVLGPNPEQVLHYLLISREEATTLSAELRGNSLQVLVPAGAAAAWLSDPGQSLSATADNGTQAGLRILVEQDLDCRHRD
ncbi:MAG: DUF7009 family protein [Adhaeribacter sp.]